MNILITGATGFLGSIIYDHLNNQDNQITTLGRLNGHVKCALDKSVPRFNQPFDLVIHSAGKAHSVPTSEKEKAAFFKVNVEGTSNLLFGLEQINILPKSFVFISSVAVYGKESGLAINEAEKLSASDAYGLSKIKGEEIVLEWCKNRGVICTILRLPLIAGPNPPGNLGSMIKAIHKGYYFNIDRGRSKKSVVLAKDVAYIILKAAQVGGVFNLTDGYHPSFKELSKVIAEQLNKKLPRNISGGLAKTFARIGDMIGNKAPINSEKLKKITSDLTFDDSKARKLLGWSSTSVLKGFKIK
ncbi:MAG: NAD-dependent epimerase/dehydratase family protein [Flavobacterium sp.]|nr:NAD-dependent epimerase/dehydratase family protein [Pedobacter sp.]